MCDNNNFRHCTGEKIDVFTAYGETSFEAVRALMKGLRKIEKKTGQAPSIASITVNYEDGLGLDADSYVAMAFVYGGI